MCSDRGRDERHPESSSCRGRWESAWRTVPTPCPGSPGLYFKFFNGLSQYGKRNLQWKHYGVEMGYPHPGVN